MSPASQNLAIAKAVNAPLVAWEYTYMRDVVSGGHLSRDAALDDIQTHLEGADAAEAAMSLQDHRVKPLDYRGDLNAMHIVEETLDGSIVDTRSLFIDNLTLICGWGATKSHSEAVFEAHYLTVRATAAQRAEAFLKTLGLWEETE